MNNSQKYLSQTIIGLLATKGKTRNDLASALGIQRRALYERLSNRSTWNIQELDTVARFLGYPDAYSLTTLAASQQRTDLTITRLAA